MNMKKMLVPMSALAVCLGSVDAARAADAPLGTKRPKILQIFREEVKPGRQAAHEKSESGWPAALRKANNKGYYLAMTSATEAWFLNPSDTFAAIEAQARADEANTALTADIDRLWAGDGDLLTKASSITAVLNEDLSFHADWDAAKTRYYAVTVVRLQPGYGREFEQVRKLVNAAHEKAKVDERWSAYEVITGAPDDTYVFFSPIVSLAEWDKYEAMHGKEFQEALGEDARGRLRDFDRAAVKSSETQLFRFSPKMSYLPKEMTDRDPDFWTPKPPLAPAGAKKEEKKP
jgi:hypothetical protein